MSAEHLKNTQKNTDDKTQKSNKFPIAFNVRASEREHKNLKELSFVTGKSLSRLVIETTLSKPLLSAGDVASERADREDMIFQLRRIGINLNQITSALHAVRRGVKASVTEARLENIAAEIESVINAHKKKL